MQEDSEAAKDREAKKEMIYHTGNLYQRYKDRKKASWEILRKQGRKAKQTKTNKCR